MAPRDNTALPSLTDYFKGDRDAVLTCPTCKVGKTFFDLGINLLSTAPIGNRPEFQRWSQNVHIQVCTACEAPIAQVEGQYYDARDFVTQKEVHAMIERLGLLNTVQSFAGAGGH